MSFFCATRHSSRDLDNLSCRLGFPPRGNESWSDPTRVRFNPTFLLFLHRYPLGASNCYVGPRFDLSRRCRQPLINVQEQLYCYVHRSSWRNARDSEESRWLFLSVLEQTSGKILEDSQFPYDNIERYFDPRIISHSMYLLANYNLQKL